ncbi:MAG: Mov34/MPN/PAD-1 family protein [Methanomassiliicoccales archaeon]|nr:Mov34/MPN/PAD-1 family protein [Methanomassiliicoccales archaeon]
MGTARPTIVSSRERPRIERDPPDDEHIMPHDWLSEESKSSYSRVLSKKGTFDLYISKVSAEKMVNHAKRYGRLGKEAMGFMLGDVCEHGRHRFAIVRDIVTGALLSSSDRVRFDSDSYSELFSELDSSGFDYVIVGWYHSHPGYGCFMSQTDLKTQLASFRESYHTAVVIDPLLKEIQAFRLRGKGYAHVDFAVYWHDLESPYDPRRVKRVRVVKKKPPAEVTPR